MLIEGPIEIGMVSHDQPPGTELHLDFTDEFKALDLGSQASAFQDYVQTLQQHLLTLNEADPNRTGMETILQIAEQLLPHVAAGDVAVEETIVVEISAQQSPSVALTDLLN